MRKKSSVGANFVYNLIYNIINIIVPLLTAPYTSRVLGAANIGIYSYTYSIVSSVILFGALGTATYGQREVAAAGDNVEKRSAIFWEIFVLKAMTTLIAFLIFLPGALCGEYWKYYLLQIPFFISGILDIGFFFQGMEQFKYTALRNSAVRIAGIILLFLFVKNQNDLWIYLLIIGLTQMLGNISMWTYLRGQVCRTKMKAKNVLKHVKSVMIYFVPSVTYQIYAVLDKAMLGWLVGSNYENGYYEQAHKIVNLIVSVISAYTVVMRSRMSALFAQKRYDEIDRNMSNSYNLIAFLVFPMTFGLAAVAAGVVPWFLGDGYEQVISLLYIFSPIFIFMGYSRMIGTHLLTPTGRQIISNYAQCTAAAVNIIFNMLLIPQFNAVGAAIASVISELSVMIIYFVMVRREIDFKGLFKAGWKKALAAMIMFGVLFLFREERLPSIAWSFVQMMIGATIYVGMLFVLRDQFSIMIISTKLKQIVRK